MDRATYIQAAIRLVFVTAVFLVLFIVFLVKSIKRGRRIKELEKKLKEAQAIINSITYPVMPMAMPQNTWNPNSQQPVVQAPPYQPVSAPAVNTGLEMPDVQAPVQTAAAATTVTGFATAQVSAAMPEPDMAPTPSWALSPSEADSIRTAAPAVNTTAPEKPKREKFFSSINITFGIGVLLLTIVGATFMTGSWPWMTESVRAISLVIMVFIVYGMAFFAGKILNLKQTGFALYSLASLLGPIVIVGMGAYNLLGTGFSFEHGSGWFVATVATMILVVSSVGGLFLFREPVQSNIYRGSTYISITWLVIFLAAQIGQASELVNEWGMICLGLATLALVFRIIGLTNLLEDESFFKVYSEIITFIPAALLLVSVALCDGAIFGATIVEFIVLVMHARFTKGRKWVKYLTPVSGILITVSWLVFGGTDEMYVATSVLLVIMVLLFVIHKLIKISSFISDIILPILIGGFAAIMAIEDTPVMGAVACFLVLALFMFQMIAEPALSSLEALSEGMFRKELAVHEQLLMSVFGALFYYAGISFIYFVPENNTVAADLYFPILALIPAIAFVVVRIIFKDDLRIRAAGLTMVIISAISSFLSIFALKTTGYDDKSIFCKDIYICAWLLTLAVIVMAVNFIVRPVKKKKLSAGAMFWISVCLNALSIGVFIIIEHNANVHWRLKLIPANAIETVRDIAAVSFLALNVAAVAAAYFIKRKGKKLFAEYASGIKYFLCGFSMMWFTVSWILIGSNWKLLAIAVIFAVLLNLLDCGFFAILPVIASEFAMMSEIQNLSDPDLVNIVLIAAVLVIAGIGRLVFRKKLFTGKSLDYLSLSSFVILFGLNGADYVPMMVFLALALLVMNLAGRVKINVRILVSIFSGLVCMAFVFQPYITYPDGIGFEINLLLMLGTLLLICKIIRPASDVAHKYFWFTGIALALIAEGISAAVTGEVVDLILVGTASFGIFIYAFIRRNRLWFILGIVSMISIAVYLSMAFWSSLVWLIYLFVAGSILVVMASVNEWGKRHNQNGKKKRFFEEWTW